MADGNLKSSFSARQIVESELGSKAGSRMVRVPSKQRTVINEEAFHIVLAVERRRAERSRMPFILMLLDARAVGRQGSAARFNDCLISAVSSAARESDVMGWYEEGLVLAVIFTELNLNGQVPIAAAVQAKMETALEENLDPRSRSHLVVTTHVFPENWDPHRADRTADMKIYPDLLQENSKKRLPFSVKRVIDVLGSILLLALFSPVLAVIALAIKMTSKGPVIFEQERLGQFGISFKCFKFRTMYCDSDPQIHRDYVRSFIAGSAQNDTKNEAEAGVYKITNDPRVTPIGKFLRRTSLDEFPQFWNALRGEMSLVGPRPALPYEFDDYDYWHRRRVLEMKPGVTGLWQVSGRSRVSFNDMVRLDLRYSRGWSLWLDLKILMATPLAVLMGKGAF
jgi:lipopolysaccharide/colanic/teichoic acid biosynthesis glycosyltransferase